MVKGQISLCGMKPSQVCDNTVMRWSLLYCMTTQEDVGMSHVENCLLQAGKSGMFLLDKIRLAAMQYSCSMGTSKTTNLKRSEDLGIDTVSMCTWSFCLPGLVLVRDTAVLRTRRTSALTPLA